MSIWFDSRDLRYKDPFGAVSCGAEVRFALGSDEPLEECCLLVRQEFAGLERELPLSPSGDGWCGVLTAPAEPELIWYAFRCRGPTAPSSGWDAMAAAVRRTVSDGS